MEQARVFQSIPVIDVGALMDVRSAREDRMRVAREIGNACRDVGFFYIRNHGVPESHHRELFEQAKAFFNLPPNKKMEVSMDKSPHFRGYIPLGGEVTNGLKDWHEALVFRKELSPDHPDVIAGKPLHGPNLWPDEPPGFKELLQAHWDRMTRLGEAVTRGLALSLGLEESVLDPFIDDAFGNMRVLYYPVHGADEPGVGEGIGPHIDYGFLTILDQDDVSGLEVMNAAGDWVAAPPIPGTYVMNIGRVTQVWTNDGYKATQHRVRRVPRDRISVPFFFSPNFDAVIEPLEACCSPDNPPRYEPYCHGEFTAGKIQSSFSAKQEVSPG